MKCVVYMDGKIGRIDDELAQELVTDHKANFIPKSEWKQARLNGEEIIYHHVVKNRSAKRHKASSVKKK